jgi:hypothetical protein
MQTRRPAEVTPLARGQGMPRGDPMRIYPYDPPRALAADLWQIKGSLKMAAIPRNMTIYRLPDGRLVLYSVIAMHEDGMRALEALGTPAILVMPHDRHQMDAPFYKRRYPALRALAPEPAKPRNVPIDGDLTELSGLGIRAYPLPGTSYHEAILELPIDGGFALCTCELLGNLSPPPRGVLGLAFKVLGPPGGGFGVSRAVRSREVVSRQAMRAWLVGLSARRDIRVITVGHGAPVTEDVQAALTRAAAGA